MQLPHLSPQEYEQLCMVLVFCDNYKVGTLTIWPTAPPMKSLCR